MCWYATGHCLQREQEMSDEGQGPSNALPGEMPDKILRAIERYQRTHNRPPTIRDICRAVDITSPSQVQYHVIMLEKKGYLTRDPHTSRSIQLTQPPGVPILGLIAAGGQLDLFDDEQHGEYLDLAAHMRTSGITEQKAGEVQEYALEVRGDSMIEDHIFDGDYVLVRPGRVAQLGDIVVAVQMLANGQRGAATVKRFYIEHARSRIRLQPANAAFLPIFVGAEEWDREWSIKGIVIAVYRPLRRAPLIGHVVPRKLGGR
jgi:repressor LexA